MSHTMKVWEKIIEASLRDRVEISKQQIWIYIRKRNQRCHVCFKNVDGKVQGSSKRATLCICGRRESLRQGCTGRAVVLYEKIRNSGKVCAIFQDMYEGSKTVVRCAAGTTESFKVKIELHQRSA